MKRILLGALLCVLVGCSTLWPKRVELFQDRVPKMPEPSAKDREALKQAVLLTADKTGETLLAAVANQCPEEVVAPATDAAALAGAVARHVGPPQKRETNVVAAVTRLDSATGAYQERVERFRARQEELVGKKVEGTGLFQIPYLLWVVGATFVLFLVIVVIWVGLRMWALVSPPVALGLNLARIGANTARRGLAQVIRGGEQFKARVEELLEPKEAEKVLELFRQEHQKAQDADVQELVRTLTR